jgi:amidase
VDRGARDASAAAAEDSLAFASARTLRALIGDRRLSPVELVEHLLARIERINPVVGAYCTVAGEQALEAAAAAEQAVTNGRGLGPLHGIPVALKDMVATAGIRTTYGSRLYAEHIPREDALEATRLKRAGAIVVGKTNTPEFAAGPNTVNALFGATRNPWDLERSAGGSSGGSAVALACGLAPLASGSDLGGSLRIPAGLCGVVGFRPSPGRVPTYPSAYSSDPFVVSGPMARTVGDIALMLSVIAGPDDRVPISLETPGADFANAAEGEVRGARVAWSADLGVARVDPEVAGIAESARERLREAGCRVQPAQPEIGELRPMIATMRALSTATGWPQLLERAGEVDNPFLREFIERARELTGAQIAQAFAEHTRHVERMSALFHEHDLLVTPTTPTAAHMLDEMHAQEIGGHGVAGPIDAMLLTYAITMAGLPAISVPAGFTAAGLPVGLQIVGGRHADAVVLRVAAAFERIAPWAQVHPAAAMTRFR